MIAIGSVELVDGMLPPVATAWPTELAPSNRVTVLPASAVPV